ncbi:helix-turn-helix domain-containing protein [Flavobacterium sp.]|uniref:helix-turn-helix domain-containing protein n=2 Tax=Flavobacterium sp. TaxID=239 RepID=UPI0037505FDE
MFIYTSSFIEFHMVKNDEKILVKEFGEKLKKIRLEKNLSQEMLANDADIPINQIGRIERAEISTSLTTIFKIAKALDINIKDLF